MTTEQPRSSDYAEVGKANIDASPSRRNLPQCDYPKWMLRFNGRPYRFVMRLMHRHGWCYPAPSLVQPRMAWCHWCGLRGRLPASEAEMQAAMKEMSR